MLKKDLKVGQRVKFSPTHQKNLQLVGEVHEIRDDHNIVSCKADQDGKTIAKNVDKKTGEEVPALFEAHVDDIQPADESDKHKHVAKA